MQTLLRLAIFILFAFSNYAICFAQVEMKVALTEDLQTYQVIIKPQVDWSPPQNTLISAQVTLVFPNGNFSISNPNYIYGLWSPTPITEGPEENPSKSYVSFTLQTPINNLPINTNEEVIIFTFENGGDCAGAVELINHDTDPFMPPNSLTLNVGNYLGLFGGGPGSNSYQGNYDVGSANCSGEAEEMEEEEEEEMEEGCSISLDGISSTAPTRCGVADGTITIDASTTGIPIQYTINGGDSWEMTNIYEGLAAGMEFEIAIRDAAAICTEDGGKLTLDAPLAAAITGIDNQPASSCTAMDGSIRINATTENGATLEYSIDDGLTYSENPLFENLGTGQYQLWIRNATNNCDTPFNSIIVECQEEEEEEMEEEEMNGNCDISFEIEALEDGRFQLNMLPSVSYEFPLNIVSTAQITLKVPTGQFQLGTIENLIDGASFTLNATYVAPDEAPEFDYIAIGLGSIGTSSIPFVADQKVPLFIFNNTIACGNSNIFLMDNANDPFFPPNSENANVSNQITVAGSGDSDTPLCLQTTGTPCGEMEEEEEEEEEEMENECSFTLNDVISTAPTRCGVADGTITIDATQTDLALQYSINGGDSWEMTNVYEGLAAGMEFDIAVRDAAAICIEDGGKLTLDAPLAAAITGIDNQPASSCTAMDGSIRINASTENGATLEYSIDDGLTYSENPLFENLGTGQYQLWIRNATNNCDTPFNSITVECQEEEEEEEEEMNDNCDLTFEIEKLENGRFQVNMLSEVSYQFPLNIVSTAQITLKVPTGQFQLGTIENLIDGASFTLNATYPSPMEEPEFDYIAIGLGSIGTSAIPFEAGTNIPLFAFNNTMECGNDEIFLMDNANDPFFPPNSENANVSNQITVAGSGDSDTPLCIKTSGITCGEVVVGSDLSVEIMQINVNCHGDNNGSATAIPAGGAQGYRYEWSTGDVMVSIDQLIAGTYDLTVTDADDNTTTTSVTITQPEPIILDFIAQMPDCEMNNGTLEITIDDPSPSGEGYAIQWTPDVSTTEIAENLPAGSYDVAIWDVNGCQTNLDNIILSNPDCPVDELPYPIAFTDTIRIEPGENFEVSVLVNDSIFSALRSLSAANRPEIGSLTQATDTTLVYQADATYCGWDQFAYIVCNARGCDAARVMVDIACPEEEEEQPEEEEFIIYTGFSPNGDDINDAFTIKGLSLFDSHRLVVFNRLGLKVYESDDYKNDWYGNFENSNLPDGVYFYFLELAGEETLFGSVTLRR